MSAKARSIVHIEDAEPEVLYIICFYGDFYGNCLLIVPCPLQNTTFWETWIAPPLEELDDHKAYVALGLGFLAAYWLIQKRFKRDWPTIPQLLPQIIAFIATSFISKIPVVGDLFKVIKARELFSAQAYTTTRTVLTRNRISSRNKRNLLIRLPY